MSEKILTLNPDRLFPIDPNLRALCRSLFSLVEKAPIVSPHGHTDPAWFATNELFSDPASLLLTPDHYLLRMLHSQGIALEKLGVGSGSAKRASPREAWRLFAENYHLFRGTPSRMWLDHTFVTIFGLTQSLSKTTADWFFDHISTQLQTDAFRPRALLDRFDVRYLSTTEGALDDLRHHQTLRADGWGKRIAPTFRPDDVLDPDKSGFSIRLRQLGEITHEDTVEYSGYLRALRKRRDYFIEHGATATDHGPSTPVTASLSEREIHRLFDKCVKDTATVVERELFRGHMLLQMARMSIDDGMVMQLHAGSVRNHNPDLFNRYGPDKGADIPQAVNFVHALAPLLREFGNHPNLTLILFTLDESTYTRELAPLAGHYPSIKLGPPWWFHDSPDGMLRFRRHVTETAGFYNTCGFNDDTRALLSIPARHDMARRMDCRFLAELVSEGRLSDDEAHELIITLTDELVRNAYKLSHIDHTNRQLRKP